jgi:hypothetical protein
MFKPRSPQAHSSDVESLYLRYGPLIYSRCCRLLGEGTLAEQATCRVFVDCLETLLSSSALESIRRVDQVVAKHCLALASSDGDAAMPELKQIAVGAA